MRKKVKRRNRFYVYIIRCSDGSYYTGYTGDIEKRFELHKNGRGAKYLKGKTPLRLVYVKEFRYLRSAIKMELKIKKMPRKKKEELVAGGAVAGRLKRKRIQAAAV